jgi:hypothetical protein
MDFMLIIRKYNRFLLLLFYICLLSYQIFSLYGWCFRFNGYKIEDFGDNFLRFLLPYAFNVLFLTLWKILILFISHYNRWFIVSNHINFPRYPKTHIYFSIHQ